MLIDIHAHIPRSNTKEGINTIIEAAQRYGIDRIYVSSLDRHFPDSEEIKVLNNKTLKAVKENPKLFGGALYVNPDNKDAKDVIKRGILEDGMELIKIWISTYVDTAPTYEVAKMVIDFDIPVLIHAMHKANGQVAHENTAQNVAALASRYPELKIIMAHMGGNVYNGISAIEGHENVFVDISMSIVRDDDLPYCIKKLGAKRILFGTDMPGVCYPMKIGQVEGAGLSAPQKELIYHKNALRLLKRGKA